MARSSVARERSQHEDKGDDLPLIGAVPPSQPPVNDVDDPWFPRLIGECANRHLAHKEICYALGDGERAMDKGQASRQLDGDGHLSAKRIGNLPREVWIDVADGIKAHFGMSDPQAEKRQAAEDAMRAIGRLLAVGE